MIKVMFLLKAFKHNTVLNIFLSITIKFVNFIMNLLINNILATKDFPILA